MSRNELQAKLDEIRTVRTEVLDRLLDAPDTDSDLEITEIRSWRSLGIVLLRFGDHMREHKNQISGIRQELAEGPTDVQRKLASAEEAWGELLGVVAGLTDSDLDAEPKSEGWTIRQTLDHILQAEVNYLNGVKTAYQQRDQQ